MLNGCRIVHDGSAAAAYSSSLQAAAAGDECFALIASS
jgi:hypothetical protein